MNKRQRKKNINSCKRWMRAAKYTMTFDYLFKYKSKYMNNVRRILKGKHSK